MTDEELRLLIALIAVGGVVVGGVTAGVFSLFTGWVDSRREHRRWQREQRIDTYVQAVVALDKTRQLFEHADQLRDKVSKAKPEDRTQLLTEATKAVDDLDSMISVITELSPRLFIVGPRKVSVDWMRPVGLLTDEKLNRELWNRYRARLVRTMQDTLRTGWPWQRVTEDDAEEFKELTREAAKAAKKSARPRGGKDGRLDDAT